MVRETFVRLRKKGGKYWASVQCCEVDLVESMDPSWLRKDYSFENEFRVDCLNLGGDPEKARAARRLLLDELAAVLREHSK